MGVFDRAKQASGLTEREHGQTYVCLACESPFDVQYHSCPECGSFDIRQARWVRE